MAGAHEVLVVGGGPAGTACAAWLADAGCRVALVERSAYPRAKTCGDGLTPRAVKQLADLGLAHTLEHHHRFWRLRGVGFGRSVELEWPDVPGFPRHGYVMSRHDLDDTLAERAAGLGADVLDATKALEPLDDARGARVTDTRIGRSYDLPADFVVVADGANSRFGRLLGTRRPGSPTRGLASRVYLDSDRSHEPFIEGHVELRGPSGRCVPGYGWVFPMGDGRVNVGAGLLSSRRHTTETTPGALLRSFVERVAPEWGIEARDLDSTLPTGWLPLGMGTAPLAGRRFLIAGDAAAMVNPFNGEGIAYALESGRLAAEALLASGPSGDAGRRFTGRLVDDYGLYYRLGLLFTRVVGRPHAMRFLADLGLRAEPLMSWAVRAFSNLPSPTERILAERAAKIAGPMLRDRARRATDALASEPVHVPTGGR